MSVERERLEVDRVMNLVAGFGWQKTKEELTDEKLIITIEKPRAAEVPPPAPPVT